MDQTTLEGDRLNEGRGWEAFQVCQHPWDSRLSGSQHITRKLWETAGWTEDGVWHGRTSTLQRAKDSAGCGHPKVRVELELCAPTLCPLEGCLKRVQEGHGMKGRRPPTASNSWWPAEADPKGCNLDEGTDIPYNESHHSESWSKHPHAFILYHFTFYLNYYFPIISEWLKDGLCPFYGLAFLSQWSGFKPGFVLANLSIHRETPSSFLFSTPVCLSFSNKNPEMPNWLFWMASRYWSFKCSIVYQGLYILWENWKWSAIQDFPAHTHESRNKSTEFQVTQCKYWNQFCHSVTC